MLIYLPSATKLRQGNVFTPVCQSFHSQGGSAAVQAGIHTAPGRYTPQQVHPLGRYTPPWQVHPQQVHRPTTVTAADSTHPTGMLSCCHKCWPALMRTVCNNCTLFSNVKNWLWYQDLWEGRSNITCDKWEHLISPIFYWRGKNTNHSRTYSVSS